MGRVIVEKIQENQTLRRKNRGKVTRTDRTAFVEQAVWPPSRATSFPLVGSCISPFASKLEASGLQHRCLMQKARRGLPPGLSAQFGMIVFCTRFSFHK